MRAAKDEVNIDVEKVHIQLQDVLNDEQLCLKKIDVALLASF